MFKKTKERIESADWYLRTIIKKDFVEPEKRKDYGKGVNDYFDEKRNHPIRHLILQIRLFAIFYADKGLEFIDEVFDRLLDGDPEIAQTVGYLHFHLDELLKH